MGRPVPRFHNYIGHQNIVDQIRFELDGSMALSEPMLHMLFTGCSGVGKTELAMALATERGTKLISVMGTVSKQKLIDALMKLQFCDFLFIDEAHNLHPRLQELLFVAIDNGVVNHEPKPPKGSEPISETVSLQPFTIIVATDQPGCLLGAFKKRFPHPIHISRYKQSEMTQIVATVATKMKICLSPMAAGHLAMACHGLPRNAKHLLSRFRHVCSQESSPISVSDMREFLNKIGIDDGGLGPREQAYLNHLNCAGSASLESLALALDTDTKEIRHDIEPILVQRNLVTLNKSKGRRLTAEGEKLMASLSTNTTKELGHK